MSIRNTSPKWLGLLSGLYIVSVVAALVLSNRVVEVFGFRTLGSSVIFPIPFFISDIIAEVYGYATMRRLTWTMLISYFGFDLLLQFVSFLPQDISYSLDSCYNRVISPLFIGAVLGILEILIGQFTNSYLLTKWRIFLKGKYFWMRSVGSTALGALIMTFVGYLNRFYSLPIDIALSFFLIAYCIKLVGSILFATPSTIIVHILKKIEPEIGYASVNYNPFKIKD